MNCLKNKILRRILLKAKWGDFTYRRVMHKEQKRNTIQTLRNFVLYPQRNYFINNMIGIIKCIYMVTFTKKQLKTGHA